MISFVLSGFLWFSSPGLPQGFCELIIQVNNIKNSNGKIAVSIYDNKETFLSDNAVSATSLNLTGVEEVIFKFKHLPVGEYAVAIYHDENANDELDTNIIGIPSEDYGFSNNPISPFGPPSFAKASFELSESVRTIVIEL